LVDVRLIGIPLQKIDYDLIHNYPIGETGTPYCAVCGKVVCRCVHRNWITGDLNA